MLACPLATRETEMDGIVLDRMQGFPTTAEGHTGRMRKFIQRVAPCTFCPSMCARSQAVLRWGAALSDVDGVPVLPKPVSSQGKQKPK